MVAHLDVVHILADGLDLAGALVAENDGENALGVLAGPAEAVGLADAGVEHLDTDLIGLGGVDGDGLDLGFLARAPRDGGGALEGLACSRHGGGEKRVKRRRCRRRWWWWWEEWWRSDGRQLLRSTRHQHRRPHGGSGKERRRQPA